MDSESGGRFINSLPAFGSCREINRGMKHIQLFEEFISKDKALAGFPADVLGEFQRAAEEVKSWPTWKLYNATLNWEDRGGALDAGKFLAYLDTLLHRQLLDTQKQHLNQVIMQSIEEWPAPLATHLEDLLGHVPTDGDKDISDEGLQRWLENTKKKIARWTETAEWTNKR